MRLLVYSVKDFEIPFLKEANNRGLEVIYSPDRLTTNTAMKSFGFDAISIFSADDASNNVLEKLHDFGVKYITLRSTGFDNVNLKTAKKFKIKVANAPGYSPYAIAEHAFALLLALNRKIVLANNQVKQNNFSLTNLVGFDLFGKRIGILGTGTIGSVIVKIAHGFGAKILANELFPSEDLTKKYDIQYLPKSEVYQLSDIIIISLPLTEETHHLIDEYALSLMNPNALVINIARGGIVDTEAILNALDAAKIAGYATDVYEKEGGIYFYDHHDEKFKDTLLKTLIEHPKVLLTPHQAFVTREALKKIAETTFYNLNCWRHQITSENEVTFSA